VAKLEIIGETQPEEFSVKNYGVPILIAELNINLI
jgi:hypothetical protein